MIRRAMAKITMRSMSVTPRDQAHGRGIVKSIGRDGDGVALALIIANERRAGFELAPGRAAVACQTLQEPQTFPIEAAEGLLLQAASHHSSREHVRSRSA
jgi:hypothetical protein